MARCWWRLDLNREQAREDYPAEILPRPSGWGYSVSRPTPCGWSRTNRAQSLRKPRWLKGSAMNSLSHDNRQGSRRRVADRRSVAQLRSSHERRVMFRREIYLPVEDGRRVLGESGRHSRQPTLRRARSACYREAALRRTGTSMAVRARPIAECGPRGSGSQELTCNRGAASCYAENFGGSSTRPIASG